MSRSSVLEATLGIIDTLENPVVHENWAKFKALMKIGPYFDHISDLCPPTLLSRQSGSYEFKFQLTVYEADVLGRGREELTNADGRSQIHYNSKVLIRCFNVQPGGELNIDCFPPNCATHVNNVVYRRGIKEGPMDITGNVRVNPNVNNIVNMDIITSPSGFYVVSIILVRVLSPSAIVRRLCEQRLRSVEFTKAKIRRYHEVTNSDVAVTSTRLSLVCPLTQKRFQVPAQGENCNHLSCFDLYTYLKLNARCCRWMCPICNNKVLPSHLIVDGYWKEVVDSFERENNCSSSVLVTGEGSPERAT